MSRHPSNDSTEPLSQHVIMRTRSLHFALDVGRRLMLPSRIRVTNGQRFGQTLRGVPLGDSFLAYLAFHAPVDIVASTTANYFALQLLLKGGVEITSDLGTVRLTKPGTATVISPTQQLRFRYLRGTEQLFVKVPQPAMRRAVAQLNGGLGCDVVFDMTCAAVFPWRSSLDVAVRAVDTFHPTVYPPGRAREELEHMILTSLLLTHPHSATRETDDPGCGRVDRAVIAISDAMRTMPEAPFDLSAAASAHGVSVRSIQDGFRRVFGSPPTAVLRELRLEKARSLIESAPEISVTEAALSSGFTHLGRFSRDYREKYGASPSRRLQERGRQVSGPDTEADVSQADSGGRTI